MSQENVEIVRAFLDASSRGDSGALMAALDPTIEWTPVKEDPAFRVHRGLEDVSTWEQIRRRAPVSVRLLLIALRSGAVDGRPLRVSEAR
jgi:ketosteroid isomerase-like protein